MKTKRRELITVSLVIGLIAVTAMAYMIYTNKFIGNKNIADNASNSKKPQALAEGETWTAETLKATVDTSTWDLNKVNIVESADGIPVPVPKGFFASELEGENTVLGGFVIYSGEEPIKGVLDEEGNKTDVLGTYSADPDSYWQQSCNRNQWVWVPCPDTSRIYEIEEETGKKKGKLWTYSDLKRVATTKYKEPGILNHDARFENETMFSQYNLQGLTRQRMLEEMETEFEATMNSIEKYGGFYIGRYLVGNKDATPINDNEMFDCYSTEYIINDSPVIRRMNTAIAGTYWYAAYNDLKNIEVDERVKTNMIWGCLWDESLQWLVDSGNKSYKEMQDMSSWGNYWPILLEYTHIDGTVSAATKEDAQIPTGSCELCNANNIYDLAGNKMDFTMETDENQAMRYGREGEPYYAGHLVSNMKTTHYCRYGQSPNSSYILMRCTSISLYKIESKK